MRFKPRHYVLIAVIVGLGIFNYIRAHRANVPQISTQVGIDAIPVAHSPAWAAFDKAAGLRDAPEAEFNPALQSLQQAEQGSSEAAIADVKGCQTWLMFYRQGVVHPSKDTSWRDRSSQHLDACVKTHHDAG